MIIEHNRSARVSKYFLLYMLISFLGWLWETLYMYFLTGQYHDRGFLTLPFCPIYATVLLSCYFLLGSIREGRGILRRVESTGARALIYLCLSFVLPTLAEIAVGAFFYNSFGIRLWDYSHMDYNTAGHIALEISTLWCIAIFVFMNKVFPSIKRLVFRIPDRVSNVLAVIIGSAVVVDVTIILYKMADADII